MIYKEARFKAKSADLLRKIQAQEIQATTSAVTLLELMLDMANSGFEDQIEAAVSALQDLPALTILPLDKSMSKTAAEHVLKDKITVHDAYHLATALHSGASYFVTRDEGLSSKIRKYVRIVAPEEIAKFSD